MIELFKIYFHPIKTELVGKFESLKEVMRCIKHSNFSIRDAWELHIFQINKENNIEKKVYSLDEIINECDLCKGQKVIGWEYSLYAKVFGDKEYTKVFGDKPKNEYKQCFRCNGLGYIIKNKNT